MSLSRLDCALSDAFSLVRSDGSQVPYCELPYGEVHISGKELMSPANGQQGHEATNSYVSEHGSGSSPSWPLR